jgi:hypothetical protein
MSLMGATAIFNGSTPLIKTVANQAKNHMNPFGQSFPARQSMLQAPRKSKHVCFFGDTL